MKAMKAGKPMKAMTKNGMAERLAEAADNNVSQASTMSPGSAISSNGQDGSSFELDLSRRLKVVEESLRVQAALGVSHLQKAEMAPECYGVPPSARTPLRDLRLRRNKALHEVPAEADEIRKAGEVAKIVKVIAEETGHLSANVNTAPNKAMQTWLRTIGMAEHEYHINMALNKAMKSDKTIK